MSIYDLCVMCENMSVKTKIFVRDVTGQQLAQTAYNADDFYKYQDLKIRTFFFTAVRNAGAVIDEVVVYVK